MSPGNLQTAVRLLSCCIYASVQINGPSIYRSHLQSHRPTGVANLSHSSVPRSSAPDLGTSGSTAGSISSSSIAPADLRRGFEGRSSRSRHISAGVPRISGIGRRRRRALVISSWTRRQAEGDTEGRHLRRRPNDLPQISTLYTTRVLSLPRTRRGSVTKTHPPVLNILPKRSFNAKGVWKKAPFFSCSFVRRHRLNFILYTSKGLFTIYPSALCAYVTCI